MCGVYASLKHDPNFVLFDGVGQDTAGKPIWLTQIFHQAV